MKGKKKSKKAFRWVCAAAALLMLMMGWVLWQNTALEMNEYTIVSDRLPPAFDGFRIAHLSDLHNVELGKDNEKVLRLLEQAQPDIIVMTGDFQDCRITDTTIPVRLVQAASRIAPCYFVTGNHEGHHKRELWPTFEQELIDAGAKVLHDEQVLLTRDGQTIALLGIDDPNYAKQQGSGVKLSMEPEQLRALYATGDFRILLSHRPEYIESYAEAGIDLVFSGHAHGGQFRLPLLGGVWAPSQGLFPSYEEGLCVQGDTQMLVSRGMGNSGFPLRLNNPPELILAELRVKTDEP